MSPYVVVMPEMSVSVSVRSLRDCSRELILAEIELNLSDRLGSPMEACDKAEDTAPSAEPKADESWLLIREFIGSLKAK